MKLGENVGVAVGIEVGLYVGQRDGREVGIAVGEYSIHDSQTNDGLEVGAVGALDGGKYEGEGVASVTGCLLGEPLGSKLELEVLEEVLLEFAKL